MPKPTRKPVLRKLVKKPLKKQETTNKNNIEQLRKRLEQGRGKRLEIVQNKNINPNQKKLYLGILDKQLKSIKLALEKEIIANRKKDPKIEEFKENLRRKLK